MGPWCFVCTSTLCKCGVFCVNRWQTLPIITSYEGPSIHTTTINGALTRLF